LTPTKAVLGAIGLCMLVSTTGCGSSAFDYSKEPDPRKREFVLGASDQLRINVWKNPELSTDARVRPDGTITMPLIGDIPASGRTPSELQKEIAAKLSSYVREGAAVSVAVTEVNSYRFTVGGNVEHGGVFTAKYYVTVSEAVAQAGGLNKFANPHKLVIVRNDGNVVRRIPIDFERVASGEHPEENLPLIAGDSLFVP
jgi:polysaccharide export outer membrane protein